MTASQLPSPSSRRPASLSRPLQSAHDQPRLYHSLFQKNNSVLSLAADESNIYSGSQGDDVLVSSPLHPFAHRIDVHTRFGTSRPLP